MAQITELTSQSSGNWKFHDQDVGLFRFLARAHLWAWNRSLFTCAQGQSKQSLSFLFMGRRTLPVLLAPLLWSNYLLKISPLITVTLGVTASLCEFEGVRHILAKAVLTRVVQAEFLLWFLWGESRAENKSWDAEFLHRWRHMEPNSKSGVVRDSKHWVCSVSQYLI